MESKKVYLGDSVYMEWDDRDIPTLKLTTEDGIRTTNTIYLEPAVLEALMVQVNLRFGTKLSLRDSRPPEQPVTQREK